MFYLWGIPMMTFSTPFSEDLSMIVFRAGIRDSQPSRPKRFSADHFFCRNSSNLNTNYHNNESPHLQALRVFSFWKQGLSASPLVAKSMCLIGKRFYSRCLKHSWWKPHLGDKNNELKQMIKLHKWLTYDTGVPQGSTLGPLLVSPSTYSNLQNQCADLCDGPECSR